MRSIADIYHHTNQLLIVSIDEINIKQSMTPHSFQYGKWNRTLQAQGVVDLIRFIPYVQSAQWTKSDGSTADAGDFYDDWMVKFYSQHIKVRQCNSPMMG